MEENRSDIISPAQLALLVPGTWVVFHDFGGRVGQSGTFQLHTPYYLISRVQDSAIQDMDWMVENLEKQVMRVRMYETPSRWSHDYHSKWRQVTVEELEWYLADPKKNCNINLIPLTNNTYEIF